MSLTTGLDQSSTRGKRVIWFNNFDLASFRDLQFDKQHYGMFLDLSYNRIEVVDILPAARRVQAGGPMWQTINLEIKGGFKYIKKTITTLLLDANISFLMV